MQCKALMRPSAFPLISHSLVWFEQCVHNSDLLRNPWTLGTDHAAQKAVVWLLISAEKAVLRESCDEMPGCVPKLPLRLSYLGFVNFLLVLEWASPLFPWIVSYLKMCQMNRQRHSSSWRFLMSPVWWHSSLKSYLILTGIFRYGTFSFCRAMPLVKSKGKLNEKQKC